MDKKVVLILVDGMRPDGMLQCKSGVTEELMRESSYSLEATTVMPSVTLPCHMSLFHSVDPGRHGITTNYYVPQVRPVSGLCEELYKCRKKNVFFYTWEELRDLTRPESLSYALYINQHFYTGTDRKITEKAVEYIKEESPDFMFLYLGETDEVGGHSCGWMSEQYLKSVNNALDCVKMVKDSLSSDYVMILLADHGGHDRGHGSDCKEDMTIPVFICGGGIEGGKVLQDVNIKDIAPTVAKLMGCGAAKEWEGKILV